MQYIKIVEPLQVKSMRVIQREYEPFFPIHPGDIIAEEIESRGLSQRKFAAQMGVSPTMLNEILRAKRPINTEMALLMEAVLGIEAGMLLNMQARYNMQVARQDKKLAARLEAIRKVAAAL